MKFAMAYSCGKDSTLALHKMIAQGHTPVALIVMINQQVGRSYFHGADDQLLAAYSSALEIPLIRCQTDGTDYAVAFERGLAQAKAKGAVAACFGDIDLQQNRQWEEERCEHRGLAAVFPLWHCDRRQNVYDLLAHGYKCLIKSANTNLLPKTIAGKSLDEATIAVMKKANIDICGENGEYHTLVIDGPIFRRPLGVQVGQTMQFGDYATAEISLADFK
ncbi:diphthine--ammonia ligase [Limosilactobacillus caccae]|uniref:Dph6-related ATP pyrophosphatase n=1 Tax=Limosilactobacillus caccae TaxID=1926284 RepID=UPI0009708186|nr:diphthine--ammonia ligase [Limosilactobacillus caccae]